MRTFAHRQSHPPASTATARPGVTDVVRLNETSSVAPASGFAHDFSRVPAISSAPRTVARQAQTRPPFPRPQQPQSLFDNDALQTLARATIEITQWAQRHPRELSQPSREVVRMVRDQVPASLGLADEDILRIIYPGRDALDNLPEPPPPERPALEESAGAGTPSELPPMPRDFTGLTHTPGVVGALTRYTDVAAALDRAIDGLPMPTVLRRVLRNVIRNRVRSGTGRSLTGTQNPGITRNPTAPVQPQQNRPRPVATTPSATTGPTVNAGPGTDIRQQYLALVCEVITGIRTAVEEGRTWEFENDTLLRDDEYLRVAQPTYIQERHAWLQQLVSELGSIMTELESGALTPTEPPSRQSLALLHSARHPSRRRAWFNRANNPGRMLDGVTVRDSSGTRRYITDMPFGRRLQPTAFPTWWIDGCQPSRPTPPVEEPTTPVVPTGRLTGRRVVVRDLTRPGATAELLTPFSNVFDQPQDTVRGATFDEQRDQDGNCFILVNGSTVSLPWSCPTR